MCYCDYNCFANNDCCDDILEIGCIDPWSVPEKGCLTNLELPPGGGCCNQTLLPDCSVQNIDYFGLSTSCYCDTACYYFDNCCHDIHEIGCFDLRNESEFTYGCRSHPNLGPESGCCDPSVSIHCKAKSTNSSDSSTCYCDDACYLFDDCCDDILEIGCIDIFQGIESQEGCLSLSGLEPGGGCCIPDFDTDCTVGNPYSFFYTSCSCDKSCYLFSKCCDDILDIGCFGPKLQYLFDVILADSSGSGSGGSGVDEGPVMCFSSDDCGASDGESPVMESSREECCLKSPFLPRSFKATEHAAGPSEAQCMQCIVIGFSQNSLTIVEEQRFLDNVRVKFYSGANNLLLKYFDIQFRIQESAAGSATPCMFVSMTNTYNLSNADFCTTGSIERVMTSSTTSIRIPDILILDDNITGEGVETFTLELVQPKFFLKSLAAYNISLPVLPKYADVIDTYVLVHANFSQLMVSIEDDDVILVKFTRSEFFGDESGKSSLVKISVSGSVPNVTDFFIIPLTYEEYNEKYVSLRSGFPTTSELVGGVDPPPGANSEDFPMDPIPFTIPAGASEPLEDIAVNYFDDEKYEAQAEGLILLIMVNESTTNPHQVQFDSGRVALLQIIDYEDTYTLGFVVSQSNVTENVENTTTVSLRTMNGSSTEIPIIVEYVVDSSSTAMPGEDYEDFSGTNVTIGANETHHDLVIPIYRDDHLEPPETIKVSLVAHVDLPFLSMCTFISYYELESRINLDLPTTTITIIDPDASEVKCYQISACGEDLMIGSMSNNATVWSLEGSVEECCLQQPFQERSYQLTEQGPACHECIVIGFEKSMIRTSEATRKVNIRVKFYSGSDDVTLVTYNVQFSVILHSENNATERKDFILKDIQKTLTLSESEVVIAGDEVKILNDSVTGEGTESFILEIDNATLVPRPEYQSLQLSSDMKTQVVLHWNHSKLEVAIEDDDIITVGFSSLLIYENESKGASHLNVSWNVSGSAPNVTYYYILPLMYKDFDDGDGTIKASFSQKLGSNNNGLPVAAVQGEDFVGDPIPFRIDTKGSSGSQRIGIDGLLLNDDRFEPRIEAFFLLIMVNETSTKPLEARLSSNAALLQIIDDEDTFTVGFAEETVTVHESSSGNKAVPIQLRIAKGNVTEIPLIIRFTVDNSSTATPGKDYEEITNASVTITNVDEPYSLNLTIYSDADFSEVNETLVIMLSVDFEGNLDDTDAASLQSRIFLDPPATTIIIVNSGISCYPSDNCEEVDGVAPFIVTSQEECCLPSPFQSRSFKVPLTSAKSNFGLQCAQCIVIGFKKSVVLAMEGTSTPYDLQVRFWSGSRDNLLDNFDVRVTVQLSSESTAIQGKHFELGSHPTQAELTQSMPAVQLGGVQINYLGQGEGNQSFVMEIINVTFIQKRGQNLSLDQGLNKCLFIHRILNQAEVVIVNNDADESTEGMATSISTPSEANLSLFSSVELLIIVIPSAIFLLICIILPFVCIVCYLSRKSSKKVSNKTLIEELEMKAETHPYADLSRINRTGTARKVNPKDVAKLGGTSLILGCHLKAMESIGEGEFGVVQKGHYYHPDRDTPVLVAIKSLKGDFSEQEVHAFLVENIQMKEFSHPNVMGLLGVSLDSGPSPYLVLPFMAGGSLLAHLKKKRSEIVLKPDSETDADEVQKCLLSMCLQIAKGMEYLAGKKFIHRDLAARNCMLDGEGIIKVADFGLSRGLYEKMYFREDKKDGVKLPFKWMAIESLQDGVFSEKTDVWSFGVTCWEVFTGGKMPYPGVSPLELTRMLNHGERMDVPDNAACSEEIFHLAMLQCWTEDPEERPTFSQLVVDLNAKLTEMANYLDLNEMDATLAASCEDVEKNTTQ